VLLIFFSTPPLFIEGVRVPRRSQDFLIFINNDIIKENKGAKNEQNI
tara:strand:+ start:956 stop:1096 length:141 start_codon:yes stop_codon:yes gene_type:complete